MMTHLHRIREICYKRLNEIPGVTLPKFEGTYVPLIRFDYEMSSREMFQYLLEKARIALAPGSNYGSKGEGYQRICIATSETIMDETITRIESALKSL